MFRHIKKHEDFVSDKSAKALADIQSKFLRKGIKLVRISDIQNAFGKLWCSDHGMQIAHTRVTFSGTVAYILTNHAFEFALPILNI